MPDLLTRRQHEAEAAAVLLLIFQRHHAMLGRGWYQASWLQRDLRSALVSPLALTYAEAEKGLVDQFGFPVYPGLLTQEARIWAADYADRLSMELTDVTTRHVRDAADEADSYADLADEVEPWFSDDRADLIAITETTHAISAGEQGAASGLRAMGLDVGATWQAEIDDRTCETCMELDGQPEAVWGLEYPGGPPGHGNCRCFLAWSESGEEN